MRHVHIWPPMQHGEARRANTRELWRYVEQHKRWVRLLMRQDPMRDNYLIIHRADAAIAALRKRISEMPSGRTGAGARLLPEPQQSGATIEHEGGN